MHESKCVVHNDILVNNNNKKLIPLLKYKNDISHEYFSLVVTSPYMTPHNIKNGCLKRKFGIEHVGLHFDKKGSGDEMIVAIASTQGKGPSMKLMRLNILSLPFVIAMAINEIPLFF